MTPFLSVLVALLFTQTFLNAVRSQDDFYDKTIDALGTTQRLYCSNISESNIYPNYSEPIAWMLPNLTVIYSNTPDGKFTFENNISTLAIENVTANDLGLYHCMMNTEDNQWFLVKLGLNARGPFYVDPWDTYWLNTVIGISAAAGFLLIVAAIYILCRVKPAWFDACNRGGGRVEPYDDDTVLVDEEGVEKKLGLDEKSSNNGEKREKERRDSDEGKDNESGKINSAFSAENDTKM